MKLTTKVVLILLSVIVVFSLVATWAIGTFKGKIYEERSLATRYAVEVVYALIDEYSTRIEKGEFDLAEGQKRAMGRVGSMRYHNGEGYFWINDSHPTVLLHPIRPDLVGTDVSHMNDSNGKACFS